MNTAGFGHLRLYFQKLGFRLCSSSKFKPPNVFGPFFPQKTANSHTLHSDLCLTDQAADQVSAPTKANSGSFVHLS